MKNVQNFPYYVQHSIFGADVTDGKVIVFSAPDIHTAQDKAVEWNYKFYKSRYEKAKRQRKAYLENRVGLSSPILRS